MKIQTYDGKLCNDRKTNNFLASNWKYVKNEKLEFRAHAILNRRKGTHNLVCKRIKFFCSLRMQKVKIQLMFVGLHSLYQTIFAMLISQPAVTNDFLFFACCWHSRNSWLNKKIAWKPKEIDCINYVSNISIISWYSKLKIEPKR